MSDSFSDREKQPLLERGSTHGLRSRAFAHRHLLMWLCLLLVIILGGGIQWGYIQGRSRSSKLQQSNQWTHDVSPTRPFPSSLTQWQHFHNELAQEAAHAKDTRLLLLGDSITEHWRGSSMGRPYRGKNKQPSLQNAFPTEWHPLVLAVSGDQTPELRWRLANGELPPALQPEAIVVLIGDNDISHGKEPERIVVDVAELTKDLVTARPQARILVNTLFPALPRKLKMSSPELVDKLLTSVNEGLMEQLPKLGAVRVIDCGSYFRRHDGSLDVSMMLDGLHPNAAGMMQWAGCMRPVLNEWLGDAGVSSAVEKR